MSYGTDSDQSQAPPLRRRSNRRCSRRHRLRYRQVRLGGAAASAHARATNPPQELLQQLGVPESVTHLSYTFNGNEGLPWISFIVHFSFSIAFAIIYCVLAERFPQIKLWQGAAFGIFVYVAFHVVLMPLMGTVPAPWNQPFAEHFSEFFGHIIWLWVIEVFRRDMRNRITHEPDAEFPLEARTN